MMALLLPLPEEACSKRATKKKRKMKLQSVLVLLLSTEVVRRLKIAVLVMHSKEIMPLLNHLVDHLPSPVVADKRRRMMVTLVVCSLEAQNKPKNDLLEMNKEVYIFIL